MLPSPVQIIEQLNRTFFGRTPPPPPLTTLPRSPKAESSTSVEAKASTRLHHAIGRARTHLLEIQNREHFWEGRVYDNVSITAEYIQFLKFVGLLDEEILEKAKNTILDDQLPDGTWAIFKGGPSNHSATVEAYFSLKLCGLSKKHKALRLAKEKILEQGGIETTRVFTKIQLALFGQYSWSRIPVISPELMLIPKQAPINLYEFSYWSRAVIVPLLIIFDRKPVFSLSESEGVKELYSTQSLPSRTSQISKFLKDPKWDLEKIFMVGQTALSLYEKSPLKPFRSRALKMAEEWILKHQGPSGQWGGIFPAMSNSLIALHLRGYPFTHPRLRKGFQALRDYAEETTTHFRMQSCESPVWDTAIALYALREAGAAPSPELKNAAHWLVEKQILDVKGDWIHKAPHTRPGGWPFQIENDFYPDVDDAALAILALLSMEHEGTERHKLAHAIDRGMEWLVGMQGTDGGWGAFDRDNNKHFLNQIPFADLKSLLDPSTPDVTGHVIEAFGAAGYNKSFKPIEKAISFLEKSQESDGSWFGRWGVNYVYGTAAVLSGLKICGENMNRRYVARARDWLMTVQNEDGGWGESCVSYDRNRYAPLGYSTPSQTAWGLLGLLSCKGVSPQVIERAVRWLLENQKENGSWDEPEWTGTGFPRHFYLRYDYYRLYFPLWALGRYAHKIQG